MTILLIVLGNDFFNKNFSYLSIYLLFVDVCFP